jgi:hypothetical protein
MRGMLLMSAFLLASCVKQEKKDNKINRTVLVYVGADNNLTNIANSNIYSMNSCVSNVMPNDNLLVFVDRIDVSPALLHIHDFKIDTIAKYPEKDSTDPAVLREIIDYMLENWKSECYGLVMWSHGTGWLPTSQLHYVAPNMNYAQAREGISQTGRVNEERINPMAPTKAFAWENRSGQRPSYSCMDLNEMADAIPDGVFDFIVFDACYMGNVEIAYALRNKAEYIISSCYEVVSYGFPYHIVTRDFLNGALGNLLNTCHEFFNYYNQMSGWERMAGISLVRTDGLDSLARCFRKIVADYTDTIPKFDVSKVQYFDRFTNHVFYDLLDFVEKLDPERETLNEFRLQMERCVPYKVSTPYIFPGDKEQIKVDSYCGLSVYIPLAKYDASGLNDDYRKTEWSQYTDY